MPTTLWFAMEEEQWLLIEPQQTFSQRFGLRELANLLSRGQIGQDCSFAKLFYDDFLPKMDTGLLPIVNLIIQSSRTFCMPTLVR